MPRSPIRLALESAHASWLARDFSAAEELASTAITLDPRIARSWALRGRVRRDAGNPDPAWHDFTKALELDPASFTVRGSRACLESDLGLHREALDDFERALADRRGASPDYNLLRIWLCRAKLGDERAASRDLRGALRTECHVPDWTWSIADTLRREIPAGELLARASTPAEICEAGFWAGERFLLDHDRPAALRAFRQAAASPLWRFTEKRSAQAELKRLGA